MERDQKVASSEDPKFDLFEDDDEFEEFEIDQVWVEKVEGKESIMLEQWEGDRDDDDDDLNDDLSLQLRRELENNTKMK